MCLREDKKGSDGESDWLYKKVSKELKNISSGVWLCLGESLRCCSRACMLLKSRSHSSHWTVCAGESHRCCWNASSLLYLRPHSSHRIAIALLMTRFLMWDRVEQLPKKTGIPISTIEESWSSEASVIMPTSGRMMIGKGTRRPPQRLLQRNYCSTLMLEMCGWLRNLKRCSQTVSITIAILSVQCNYWLDASILESWPSWATRAGTYRVRARHFIVVTLH